MLNNLDNTETYSGTVSRVNEVLMRQVNHYQVYIEVKDKTLRKKVCI
jgi:hypothetical protein